MSRSLPPQGVLYCTQVARACVVDLPLRWAACRASRTADSAAPCGRVSTRRHGTGNLLDVVERECRLITTFIATTDSPALALDWAWIGALVASQPWRTILEAFLNRISVFIFCRRISSTPDVGWVGLVGS